MAKSVKVSDFLERMFGPCPSLVVLQEAEPSGRVGYYTIGVDGETDRCGMTAAVVTLDEGHAELMAERDILENLTLKMKEGTELVKLYERIRLLSFLADREGEVITKELMDHFMGELVTPELAEEFRKADAKKAADEADKGRGVVSPFGEIPDDPYPDDGAEEWE